MTTREQITKDILKAKDSRHVQELVDEAIQLGTDEAMAILIAKELLIEDWELFLDHSLEH